MQGEEQDQRVINRNKKTHFIVECPVCGLKHKHQVIEKGQVLSFYCHVQFDPRFGCGTYITIITK